MHVLAPGSAQVNPSPQIDAPPVLGTQLLLNLEEFPELGWLSSYLCSLHTLHQEADRLTQAIQAIHEEGDIYRDCWIEPYTKTKKGKQYTYHQLRWLLPGRKPSNQPKVKTKHLSHKAAGQARAAIERGKQIERLEQERRWVEAEIARLRQRVQATDRRLQQLSSQNSQNHFREGDR